MFRAAQALLLTAGGAAALLLIVWNAPLLALGVILTAALAWRYSATGDRRSATGDRRSAIGIAPIAVLAALHAYAGTRPQLWDWNDWLISRRDYFFIWGYKARLFFVDGGIPWHFLQRLPNDFSHPDYPLLVPLLFDVPVVLTGHFDPRMFALIETVLGAAVLVIAHQCLRDELPPLQAALGTIALSGTALLPWFGFADPILVAFAATGALLIRRYLRGHSGALGPAIACLAFAAMSKNEGIAFFVAVCLAAPAIARRLWPAAGVIAAWLGVRIALGLHTDVFSGRFLARIAHNVAMFPHAFANIPAYGSLIILAALVAVALSPAENLRRERFLLSVVAIQISFYLAAYAMTPHDVIGHVNGSWDRISSHVTLLVGFAGITSLRRS